MNDFSIEARLFRKEGDIINNARFPLVLMRATEAARSSSPAQWFEDRFAENGWGGSWRWKVYPFHHFHTNTHEVLGVSRGEAELLMGGVGGECFKLKVGDVVVIPAGVGHKCESNSTDFEVVGAYPDGKIPDLVRSVRDDAAGCRETVLAVELPAMDPVFGAEGPLFDHWK